MNLKWLFLVAISFFGLSVHAQNELKQAKEDWQLLQSTQGLKFYIQEVECRDVQENFFQNSVLLKIENTTNSKAEIEWITKAFYDGRCADCDLIQKATINKNESIEGNCDIYSEYNNLRIFKSFLKKENQITLDHIKVEVISINGEKIAQQ